VNAKSLLALIVAVAVLAAVSLFMSPANGPAPGTDQPFLPGLRDALNQIDRMTITGNGGHTIATLERRDDNWVVAERSGYPADMGKLRRLLIALADAVIIEEKTSNPEYYDRLGVEDVEREDAAGRRIDLHGMAEPLSVIIGETAGNGTYVRQADRATSWLVSGEIRPGGDTTDWLDTSVLDIPADRITSVTITHPDGSVLRITRAEADSPGFEVMEVPANRQLSYPTVGNSIGNALAALRFDDVEPAADFEPGDTPATVAHFETSDGLNIDVSSYPMEDQTRIRFDVGADAEADAKAEAEDLKARLEPWVYILPAYKADQFVKRMDDLLLPPDT